MSNYSQIMADIFEIHAILDDFIQNPLPSDPFELSMKSALLNSTITKLLNIVRNLPVSNLTRDESLSIGNICMGLNYTAGIINNQIIAKVKI